MTTADPSIPTVQTKRAFPEGLLPKNTQGRLLAGVALVMVAIIAFSGRNSSNERRAPAPTPATVSDPNPTRIEEYSARIEEQSRKVALEKERLARTQQALGAPNLPAGPEPGQSNVFAGESNRQTSVYSSVSEAQKSWIQLDREKREYESLFAPNIVLSYRQGARGNAPPSPISAGQSEGSTSISGQAIPPDDSTVEVRTTKVAEQDTSGQPGIRAYRLFEGTVIETVLINRLDGAFSGPVNCMVTTDLYSLDGRHLLIPRGSRALGEVQRVETFGQQRLAVFFHRLIMPNGNSVNLDKFKGLNQIGETGLVDQVNRRYFQIFSVSAAIGAIAGLAQANTQYGAGASSMDIYRQGVTGSLAQSSTQILDHFLNVLPTFTIREGHRVKVYVTQDLLLPAYDEPGQPKEPLTSHPKGDER